MQENDEILHPVKFGAGGLGAQSSALSRPEQLLMAAQLNLYSCLFIPSKQPPGARVRRRMPAC